MTTNEPTNTDPRPAAWLTRRRLLLTLATGVGGLTLLAASDVLGHGDDDDSDQDDRDDEGRGRGRGRSDDDGGDDDGGDDEVQPAGQVPAGSVEVQIVEDDVNGFQPGTVTIDLGQSVTWVNLDDDAHTATGAGFDTGIMQPGALETVTFTEPGAFAYTCQIHPEMVGRVEVRDQNGTVPTTRAATPEASPQATPGAATPAAAGSAEAEVTIVNIAFDPPQLEVAIGTTVTWTNAEPVPHTVTATDGSFDSGTLEEGDVFVHTFDTAGTFEYICSIHPTMTASVTVTA